MARAPFQVLVLPFRRLGECEEYAVLKRSDSAVWQFVAGGGEDQDTPAQAARREAEEEVGIPHDTPLYELNACSSISAGIFTTVPWSRELYVIPEYSFAIELDGGDIELSHEHTGCLWLPYEEAYKCLHWQSNQVALWELSQRILRDDLILVD